MQMFILDKLIGPLLKTESNRESDGRREYNQIPLTYKWLLTRAIEGLNFNKGVVYGEVIFISIHWHTRTELVLQE